MVYIDNMEMMLPAFAGELLACICEITYTSTYSLELRSAVWAEDLVTSMSYCYMYTQHLCTNPTIIVIMKRLLEVMKAKPQITDQNLVNNGMPH